MTQRGAAGAGQRHLLMSVVTCQSITPWHGSCGNRALKMTAWSPTTPFRCPPARRSCKPMTTPRVGHIFRLAQIIQESCEHCTDQEATFLAKAILEHPGSRWCPQQTPESEGPTDEDLLATQNQAVASFPPVHPDAEALSAVEYARELEIRKARAVLARYALPVPVSPTS